MESDWMGSRKRLSCVRKTFLRTPWSGMTSAWMAWIVEASRLERLSIASAGVVKLGLRESFQYVSKLGIPKFLRFKHVRCNPDVAPRLTSGGYEDQVDVILPNQHIVHRGWQILIPYEDKADVVTPINILFIGGGEFGSLMEI